MTVSTCPGINILHKFSVSVSAKDDYFKEQLELNVGNQAKFWQTVNDILGHNPTQCIKEMFILGTEILCSEEDSVEVINQFFAEVGEKVSQNQAYM